MEIPFRVTTRKLGERYGDTSALATLLAQEAQQLAGDFAVVGHSVRMQLLHLLARAQGRVCVADLEAAVPVKQPTVSHHLRVLREAGLVGVERDGLWAYYHLDRPAVAALRRRIGSGLDTVFGENAAEPVAGGTA